MITNYREFTVAAGGTTGSVFLEEWDTLGLIIPTIDSATLTFSVSHDGVTFCGLKDGGGTATMAYAAGTGNFAIDSRDMASVVGYQYLKVTLGAAQSGGARTFILTFKSPRRQ